MERLTKLGQLVSHINCEDPDSDECPAYECAYYCDCDNGCPVKLWHDRLQQLENERELEEDLKVVMTNERLQ